MFLPKEDIAPKIFTGGWSHRYQKENTFKKYAGKLDICKKQKIYHGPPSLPLTRQTQN